MPALPVQLKPYEGLVKKSLRENRRESSGVCVFLMTVPLMFTFVYHVYPTAVVLSVGASFLIGLAPLAVGASLLSAFLTSGVLLTTISGLHCYNAYVQPIRSFQNGRTYTGVYATQPSTAFSDAAVLRFAANASIDDTKTMGMKTLEGGLNTYCVAPIIDAESMGRVEFWAIGLNCCGKMSDFHCDDAGNDEVHDSYVIPDPLDGDVWFELIGKYFAPSISRRDLFMKAVSLAESAHGLASSARPIMVRWTSTTRSDLVKNAWIWLAVVLAVLSLVTALAAVVVGPMVKQARSLWTAQVQEARREDKRPAQGFHQVILQAFVMPFVSFALLVVLGSWSHCFRLGDTLLGLVQTIVVAGALVLLAGRESRGHGAVLLACAFLGVYIGRMNYFAHSFYFCEVKSHRSYSNVPASAKAIEHQDAGKVKFDAAALLGVSSSVGFLYRGTNYCAAPIVTPECSALALPGLSAPAGFVVCEADFWAVGTNCCGPRGGFDCGDYADGKGIVLRDAGDQGVDDEMRRNFLRAVRASADIHEILVSESPVLVRLAPKGRKLDGLLSEWRSNAIGVCLLCVCLGFVATAGVAFASLSWQKART